MLKTCPDKFTSINDLVSFREEHAHDPDLQEHDYLNPGNTAFESGLPSPCVRNTWPLAVMVAIAAMVRRSKC